MAHRPRPRRQSGVTTNMPARRSLIVQTSILSGGATFVVACDDPTLRWLGTSFRRLRERKPFTLGDGPPIASDGQCVIELVPGAPETCIAINPGHFRWALPTAQARRYADLIDAMADCPVPCHQYLEGQNPDLPVVIVSKGEYDLAALRKMRHAGR